MKIRWSIFNNIWWILLEIHKPSIVAPGDENERYVLQLKYGPKYSAFDKKAHI